MELKRRDFVLTSIAAISAMAGCESTQSTSAHLPGIPGGSIYRKPTPGPTVVAPRPVPTRPTPTPAPVSPVRALARTSWTSAQPDRRNINPMKGVNRITIHHDGLKSPLVSTSVYQSKSYLELIRKSHRNRGWADIGYHYAIDKAGRVWAARDIRYQGAHVKDKNEHNVGVLVMGNFNIQTPTSAQLNTLSKAVVAIRTAHGVSPNAIYTHRELGQTTCPGRHLQPKIATMRARKMFA